MSQCISRLVNTMVAIEGENVRLLARLNVGDWESGAWGIGDLDLTGEAARAFAGRETPVTAR